MTDEERAIKCLRNEADTYRKALVQIWGQATSGSRKTLDKDGIGSLARRAIDDGNTWHRKGKGES